MMSPLWAEATAARREPAPLSWVFVTVSVLSSERSSSASTRGRKVERWREDAWLRRQAAGAERFQFRSQEENDMIILLSSAGLRYNEKTIVQRADRAPGWCLAGGGLACR